MLQLLYHNILIRAALILLFSGVLIILFACSAKFAVFWLKVLFLFVGILILLSIIKEVLFFRSAQAKYLNLALLLIKTRELEHLLTSFGAQGKGLYEKTESIFYNNKELLEEILFIATVRNDSMHGNAKIKNIVEVLDRVKKVKKFFLLVIPTSRRIMNNLASFMIIANSIYLTIVMYVLFTHDIGKLLFLYFIFYVSNIFLKINIGSKKYLIVVFFVLMYTILLMYENGKYLFVIIDGMKDAFEK